MNNEKIDISVVVPLFNEEERARGLTDFNDLHQSRGLEEVKKQVGQALVKVQSRVQDKSRGLSL